MTRFWIGIAFVIGSSFMVGLSASQAVKRWRVSNVGSRALDVVETSSMCIYVIHGGYSGGIAVYPKHLLPEGVGCQ